MKIMLGCKNIKIKVGCKNVEKNLVAKSTAWLQNQK